MEVKGKLNGFTTAGAITIVNGQVQNSTFSVNNINGSFVLNYQLKAVSGLGVGAEEVLRVPFDLRIPLVVGVLPFYVGVEASYFLRVGFSKVGQQIAGSYTGAYSGVGGWQFSPSSGFSGTGSATPQGAVQLDQSDAQLSGPIGIVIGAEAPRIDLGVGVEGAVSVAGFIDFIGTTAIQVGGNSSLGILGGLGGSTGGCDARALMVVSETGIDADVLGHGFTPYTKELFSKEFDASYPPGCGAVGG
jgi:hypothetical protein